MSARPDQYMLNLPDGMRDSLKAAAKANGRSMNAEIVARLEASGKTLRDEFAMAALIGMLANGLHPVEPVVGIAYSVADLMLAERKKGGAS